MLESGAAGEYQQRNHLNSITKAFQATYYTGDPSKNMVEGVYEIKKLKGTENWNSWEEELQNCLKLSGLWHYVSGLEETPIQPDLPVGRTNEDGSTAPITKTQQTAYDAELNTYMKEHKEWTSNNARAYAAISIACDTGPQSHIVGLSDGKTAYEKLKNIYRTSDLTTIDLAVQEMCRKSMADFHNVRTWAEHLKKQEKEIRRAGKIMPNWIMSSIFRMGLTRELSPYMFILMQDAKQREIELTIDDIIKALVDQTSLPGLSKLLVSYYNALVKTLDRRTVARLLSVATDSLEVAKTIEHEAKLVQEDGERHVKDWILGSDSLDGATLKNKVFVVNHRLEQLSKTTQEVYKTKGYEVYLWPAGAP
ncbi:serine carboxypeptidase [Physcia stellaris]|nr:serine carboxypeptidase [Physcia stellaris]